MLPVERLDAIIARAEALQEEMNAELPPERFVELSKEYAEIDPLVSAIKIYRAALAERGELAGLAAGDDAEMAELASTELADLEARVPEMEHALEILLLPRDAADDLNIILEVRAGTGGDDANLPDDSFINISYNFMTPVDADNTRYFWFQHRNSQPDNEEISRQMFEGAKTAFIEDREVLTEVHRGMKESRTRHINLGIDAGAMRFRKMVERRIAAKVLRA